MERVDGIRVEARLIEAFEAKPWEMKGDDGAMRSGVSRKVDVAVSGVGSCKINVDQVQHDSLRARPFGTPLVLVLRPRVEREKDRLVFEVSGVELAAPTPAPRS